MNRSTYPALILILALYGAVLIALAPAVRSTDLQALWLAGQFWSSGATDQIYASETGIFTMVPPDSWAEAAQVLPVFPYIYPPIWAALSAEISRFVGWDGFRHAASVINATLVPLMVILAWRTARPGLKLQEFLLIGLVVILFSAAGMIGLFENQPQILVSFLLVLTIERDRAGAQKAAGAALALAAAIKLYPVLFVALWIAAKRWTALGTFVVVGGALGLASLAIAGWPLHAQFLDQVGLISDTALVTGLSFNFDPMIAQVFFADQLKFIHAPLNEGYNEWSALPKGSLWSGLSKVAMFGVVIGVAFWVRRADPVTRSAYLWPLAIALAAVFGPISWCYHYLPVLAFAPALLPRLGTLTGIAILSLVTIGTLPLLFPYYVASDDWGLNAPSQIVGLAAMSVLTAAFAWAAVRAPLNGRAMSRE